MIKNDQLRTLELRVANIKRRLEHLMIQIARLERLLKGSSRTPGTQGILGLRDEALREAKRLKKIMKGG